MDDLGGIVGGIIGILGGGAIGLWWLKGVKIREKQALEAINIVIDDSLRINPQMKESLKQFSITNASELRAMNPQELIVLLACSSNALRVFEKRVERISDGYVAYENLMVNGAPPSMTPLSRSSHIKAKEKELAPVKAQLDEQATQALATFDEDLKSEGSVLNVIPEKYRLSIILDMMCEYLSDGEVDSWEGCIKTFKEDAHRMREIEYFQDFADSLERIANNTKAIAFFSGITALNTGRIAAKL